MIPTFRLKKSTLSQGVAYAYKLPSESRLLFLMNLQTHSRTIPGALQLSPGIPLKNAFEKIRPPGKDRVGSIVLTVNYRLNIRPALVKPAIISLKLIGRIIPGLCLVPTRTVCYSKLSGMKGM